MLKKFLFHSCFLFFLFIAHCSLFIVKAQDTINLIPINRDSTYDLRLTTYDLLLIDSIFKKRGEIYFKTFINSRVEINKLTRIISIDRVKKKIVFAYANKKEFTEFLKLKYKFTILTSPGKLRKPRMLKSIDEKKNDFWNYYPSYIVYVKLMHKFVNDYPALCKLDTI